MVTMFAPDGTTGQIPQEHMSAAVAAGGKLAVDFISPQGQRGYIPLDRVHDAIQAGGHINDAVINALSETHDIPAIGQGFAKGALSTMHGAADVMGGQGLAQEVGLPNIDTTSQSMYEMGGKGLEAATELIAGGLESKTVRNAPAAIKEGISNAVESARSTARHFLIDPVTGQPNVTPTTLVKRILRPKEELEEFFANKQATAVKAIEDERQAELAAQEKLRQQYAEALEKREAEQNAIDAQTAKTKEEAQKAEDAGHADFEKKLRDIEQERQKELADAEKLKQQHAESLTDRGSEQSDMDKSHAERLEKIEQARQKELSEYERFKEQDAAARQRRGAQQSALDKKAAAAEPKTPKIATPADRGFARTGNEGSAARWTNERVIELAKQGDREAITQAIRRGLPLPDNARYIMGDADFEGATYNPRDVTTFSPDGAPIRQGGKVSH